MRKISKLKRMAIALTVSPIPTAPIYKKSQKDNLA
jgi:hypothetical protein